MIQWAFTLAFRTPLVQNAVLAGCTFLSMILGETVTGQKPFGKSMAKAQGSGVQQWDKR